MPSSAATVTSAPKAADAADAKHDFFWTYTEEPHRTRRLAIIKAHPEVSAIRVAPEPPLLTPRRARSPSSAAPSL